MNDAQATHRDIARPDLGLERPMLEDHIRGVRERRQELEMSVQAGVITRGEYIEVGEVLEEQERGLKARLSPDR